MNITKKLHYQVIPLLLFLFTLIRPTNSHAQPPTITSFSPSSGSAGTLVTILGNNLSSPTIFSIGGKPAIVVSNTGTKLVGMAMPGAATGAVSVTTAGGNINSSSNFTLTPTAYPAAQQGAKLIGTGAFGNPRQGGSVCISADGNTAIVGGPSDSSGAGGAAWIYTRSGNVWTQQGAKLVGTGSAGSAGQGSSVSISADGNTAAVGAPSDNSGTGAVWIYTRSGGAWTQQGSKLTGTGAVGKAGQGYSVSISADGNTVFAGGPSDNHFFTYGGGAIGAAWVFTRSGGVWAQQGTKLVGGGYVGRPSQGWSVAISSDGNTAIVGSYRDDGGSTGAIWVYTRSGNTWTQQGAKLVGTGAEEEAGQGWSVAISADGNTLIEGAPYDDSTAGAAWIFTRFGGVWTQQGGKLVGTGAVAGLNVAAHQGCSVSISADGNTAIVGGDHDLNVGAAWVFTRSGGVWTQHGSKLTGTGAVGWAQQGTSVSISSDGNTAIIGGAVDNSYKGAAWIFTSSSGSPVPVKLIDFTGKKQGPNNLLHWLTASEQNNKGFELQRSADGNNFSDVSFINTKAAQGNSTVTLNYSFTDKTTLSGNNFYRLKQIDNDGKETLSNIVFIKVEMDSEMLLSLSPNPSGNQFTLIIHSINTEAISVTVTDAAGKIVYAAKGNAEQVFPFGERFPDGLYLVEVRQGHEMKRIKAVKGR